MYVVQNSNNPGEILNALHDIMRGGVSGLRVCCAYVTLSGSEVLLDGVNRASAGAPADIAKTIVCSLDFGLTDPEALEFWRGLENCEVFVSGTDLLASDSLQPRVAFHPKLYVFDRQDAPSGSFIGSANLTNRGLAINSEVGWAELRTGSQDALDRAWQCAVEPAVRLTDDILNEYRRIRHRAIAERPVLEFEPVPQPVIGQNREYRPFSESNVDPGAYRHMWVQARGMQGGAGTQLELPRGSHRFFNADYDNYAFGRVNHIAEPILVSGHQRWDRRPLTWHGDNAMERINMPSRAMGGFSYENSLILFRRIGGNAFEFRVYPWGSDYSHAYLEAARQRELLFRIGRNSNRFVGFLP